MAGQVAQGGNLQPAQRDMRGVQINGDDLARIGGQVRQRIAAATGDRQDAPAGRDFQRGHVGLRIFPDLRVDQPLEGKGKRALEQATAVFGGAIALRGFNCVANFNRHPFCIPAHPIG